MSKDSEYYFIQYLFCKNRDLLKEENRELYDLMYEKYKKLFNEAPRGTSVEMINKVFVCNLFSSQK